MDFHGFSWVFIGFHKTFGPFLGRLKVSSASHTAPKASKRAMIPVTRVGASEMPVMAFGIGSAWLGRPIEEQRAMMRESLRRLAIHAVSGP